MSEILAEVQAIKAESERIGKEGKDLIAKAQQQIAEMQEKAATKEDIAGFIKKYGEQVEALIQQQDQLATDLKKSGGVTQEQKGFSALVDEQLTAKKDELLTLKNSKGQGGVSFDVKAVGTQLLANYNGGTGYALTTWDNEVAKAPRVNPFMRQLVNVSGISSLYVAWAEFTGGEGGATGVLEGAKKPQKDFDWIESSKKVEKIAVWTKVSKEALADIKMLRQEINTELVFEVEKELDRQILNGTGTSPEILGINNIVNTISVAGLPFALGVESPNLADALLVGGAVISNNGFDANYAVINPLDAAMMTLTKDANGNYVMPPFSAANGQTVAGVRVVANRGVPVGTFLIGDFNRVKLRIREEINLQVGYENDDFTRNLVTILAEMRQVQYIKAQHIPAIVKGSFATLISAIRAV